MSDKNKKNIYELLYSAGIPIMNPNNGDYHCPKCMTKDFNDCKSIKCPMRDIKTN